jgi:hypothetical protein
MTARRHNGMRNRESRSGFNKGYSSLLGIALNGSQHCSERTTARGSKAEHCCNSCCNSCNVSVGLLSMLPSFTVGVSEQQFSAVLASLKGEKSPFYVASLLVPVVGSLQ